MLLEQPVQRRRLSLEGPAQAADELLGYGLENQPALLLGDVNLRAREDFQPVAQRGWNHHTPLGTHSCGYTFHKLLSTSILPCLSRAGCGLMVESAYAEVEGSGEAAPEQ